MAHLLRIIPDSSLVRGYLVTGANVKDIDQNTFLSINGDAGGTWAPSAHLVISGQGVAVAGPWRMNGANVTASSPFTFAKGTADDYWQLPVGHTNRTYTVYTYFLESFTAVPTDIAESVTSSFFVPSGIGDSGVNTFKASVGVRFATPINVYNGGTITTVLFNFRVNESHLPQNLPRFRVVAQDAAGVLYPLRAADTALTDVDGFVTYNPSPATAAAWYASGANQRFTYTCNQNQVIDTSKYVYYIEIIEESGTNSFSLSNGNTWHGVETTFTTISVLDGRP